MNNIKLIKSFIVKKQNENFIKGDVFVLIKSQAQIPLIHDELYFQSKETGSSFTLKHLVSFLNKNLDVQENFITLGDKFDYLT
jgi:hypothetical protein